MRRKPTRWRRFQRCRMRSSGRRRARRAPPGAVRAVNFLVATRNDDKGGQPMALGYDGMLYILAFDHRGSFQKKMFGIQGDPTPEETATITDAKHLIYEGMEVAVSRGAGRRRHRRARRRAVRRRHPAAARAAGLKLAMPVEKSGQNEFDFQYGAEFGAHIEKFNPDFSKVLVRYNPDDPDVEMNQRQLGRLKRAGRLAARARSQVPVRAAGPRDRGTTATGRRRRRPLRRRAAARS